MLNKVIIMGRLVKDPELRRTQSGTAVTSFRIAVDRDFKSRMGSKQADFFDVVAWRATAEFVSKYFTKGRMAVVEGRLQTRTGRTGRAENVSPRRSSPITSISAIPSATAPAISAAHPLYSAPRAAAIPVPHPPAATLTSPRSARKTANCRSDFDKGGTNHGFRS